VQVDPECRQGQNLKAAVDEQIVKEGLIGIGIGAGVLGVIGLGIAAIVGGGRR
jgi:mitochondrial fission 1 protein